MIQFAQVEVGEILAGQVADGQPASRPNRRRQRMINDQIE
jgi:hypothetical protein